MNLTESEYDRPETIDWGRTVWVNDQLAHLAIRFSSVINGETNGAGLRTLTPGLRCALRLLIREAKGGPDGY
jgi:hypothetical protein